MRIKLSAIRSFAVLALVAVSSLSCVPSLQSLIEDEDAVAEPALVGTWVEHGDDAWRRLAPGEAVTEDHWLVEPRGETEYSMKFVGDREGAKPEIYTGRVARFSTGTYLEIRADADDYTSGEFLPLHLLSRARSTRSRSRATCSRASFWIRSGSRPS